MFDKDRELAKTLYYNRLKRRRAFLLSLLIPGLGQLLEGRPFTAFLFLSLFLFPFYYLVRVGEFLSYGGISLVLAQILLYALQAYDAFKGKRRETSPCEDSCPAKVNVPSFMSLSQLGDFEGAYASFMSRAPFPFTLGEICPAECEKKCGILPERPLRIREVHREFGREVLKDLKVRKREPFFPEVDREVAVIGGGIAGLTVAYYLASCGVKVRIFEKENELGGTLNFIPWFKLDRELYRKEIELVTSFRNIKVSTGVELKERPKGFELVIVAVGSQLQKPFEVKGEGVIYPLDFLRKPPPLAGKRVIVVGAGDTAFDVARLSVRLGGEALILYRDKIRAMTKEVKKAVKEGVKLYRNCQIEAIKGKRAKFTCGEVDFDYLVPAIGFRRDEGLIESLRGDFVTGDASTGMGSAVRAVSMARKTAYEVLKELGLSSRCWFMEDFYYEKPLKVAGKNLFVVSESSLCQHCGMKVKS